jgi:hypothetical protein
MRATITSMTYGLPSRVSGTPRVTAAFSSDAVDACSPFTLCVGQLDEVDARDCKIERSRRDFAF